MEVQTERDLWAEELLILNPLLYSNTKKYIWISDSYEEYRNAQAVFAYLLKENIYIEGFVTRTSSLIGLKLYNKRIYEINILDKESAALFYDTFYEYSTFDIDAHRVRIINPDLHTTRVIIWGAGITGEYVHKVLTCNGFQVDFFVDSNKELEGTCRCGLPIYMPDKLDELSGSITVVEALWKWRQVDELIGGKYDDRYYCIIDDSWEKITYNVNGTKKVLFRLSSFWTFSRFTEKRVYIYGTGDIEKELVKYLRLLDFEFAGFLTDEKSNGNDCSVKSIEDVVQEKDYYIWIWEKDERKIEKMKELGLRYLYEYECTAQYHDFSLKRIECWDLNLGLNYLTGSKYPGIMVYGNEKDGDYKIAVLGNSTSDGAMFSFKSWPQLLYEELGKEGVTVYNGAVRGDGSGQELFRLIRDILPLMPDMILVCDGVNEPNAVSKYPFAFGYVKRVYDYAVRRMDEKYSIVDDSKNICFGAESRKDYFHNWLANIRSMYAIASERGIEFFSFCQPWLSSKKNKTAKEKSMLLSIPAESLAFWTTKTFRDYISQSTDMPDYIHDLSDIFDEESEIYIDLCHVWEKGNRMIARKIKKIILPHMSKKRTDNE